MLKSSIDRDNVMILADYATSMPRELYKMHSDDALAVFHKSKDNCVELVWHLDWFPGSLLARSL